MQQSATKTQGWHIKQWGVWGWAETILRLIGLGAGVLALSGSFTGTGLTVGGHPRPVALLIIALLTLLMPFVFIIRITQREIISIVFAAATFIGHLAMLIALLQIPTSLTWALIFGAFAVLGALAKLVFLQTTGYTENGMSSAAMFQVNAIFGGIYVVYMLALIL